MKTIYAFYVWLIAVFSRKTGGLPAEKEETSDLLTLDLQFFAAEDDDPEDNPENDVEEDPEDDPEDDEEDDEADDVPDLDELLKDKTFKKQYNARLKEQLGKRMKKHERELERLKSKSGGKDAKKTDGAEDDDPDDRQEAHSRLARAERREKRALVKEYAADNGHSPKLLTRLINIDDIELDEDGEPENLDDLIEELEEEFPELFGADDEDDDDRPRKKKFTPGTRQKMNKKKKADPVAQALADIERRHGKKKKED